MDDIILPHDRLDAYRVSLDFVELTRSLLGALPKGHAELSDQLRRASFSITPNIAEGSGEFSPKEKIRFYRMALRSVTECAAVLDILQRSGSIKNAHHIEGRRLLDRLVAMLTRLARRPTAEA